MKKILAFITLLVVSGCNGQTANTAATPSPAPDTATLSVFSDIKGTFKVETFSRNTETRSRPGYTISMSVDESGNGVIVSNKLVKVKNFLIAEDSFDFVKDTFGSATAVHTDKSGNGLVVWGEGAYDCFVSTGNPCPSVVSHVWGRKLENFEPKGDFFVIDESPLFKTPKPFIKLDETGNGSVIYSTIGKVYYKEIINFQVRNERKEYIEDLKTLSDSFKKSVNSNGKGAMVYNEGKVENGNTVQDIYFKSIIDNKLLDDATVLSVNKTSVKREPLLSLNKYGDGLVVWTDSFSGSCNYCEIQTPVYARYIKNFSPL